LGGGWNGAPEVAVDEGVAGAAERVVALVVDPADPDSRLAEENDPEEAAKNDKDESDNARHENALGVAGGGASGRLVGGRAVNVASGDGNEKHVAEPHNDAAGESCVVEVAVGVQQLGVTVVVVEVSVASHDVGGENEELPEDHEGDDDGSKRKEAWRVGHEREANESGGNPESDPEKPVGEGVGSESETEIRRGSSASDGVKVVGPITELDEPEEPATPVEHKLDEAEHKVHVVATGGRFGAASHCVTVAAAQGKDVDPRRWAAVLIDGRHKNANHLANEDEDSA